MTRRSAPPPRRAPASRQKLLIALVAASCVASVVAIVWFRGGSAPDAPGRRVDPEHLSGDLEDAAEVAESFINFWSTFRYDDALAVSSEETRRRVLLAIDKEKKMSTAERSVANDLRSSVEGLVVRLEVNEVVEDGADRKTIRGIATATAADRQFRRHQEFVMVKDGGDWKVAAWDPGEAEEGPEGAAEPGLQGIEGVEVPRDTP